jgi:hypothetical protein
MKTWLAAAMTAAMIAAPVASVSAQTDNDYRWNGDRDSDWDPYRHYTRGQYEQREMTNDERVYRGSDGRYYCKRSDGTTGLVIGALGGGLIGHALGGGVLGTLLGAGVGGVAGKHIDQHESDRQHGYRCE